MIHTLVEAVAMAIAVVGRFANHATTVPGSVLSLNQLYNRLGRKPQRGALPNLKESRLYTYYSFKLTLSRARCSSVVRWVVGSILHGVDPLSYFSFQPVLHDWCNKGRCMCYLVCGMVHIKEPLLLIGKSSPCGGSGFPFSLSEWSLTICLAPYNRK